MSATKHNSNKVETVLQDILDWTDSASRAVSRLEQLIEDLQRRPVADADGKITMVKPDIARLNNAIQLTSNMLLIKGMLTSAGLQQYVDKAIDYLLRVHFGLARSDRQKVTQRR